MIGPGIVGYEASHYVAPFASVANSPTDDEDDFAVTGNGVSFASATSEGNPCTLMTATEAMSAGNYVQAAPGIYDSIATSTLPGTFIARFHIQGAGTSGSNRAVLFAQYPGAYYWDQPSLLSELRQTYTGPAGDNPDPIIGTTSDYVTIDGFYIDASVTLGGKNEGCIMAAGSSTGVEILRNYIDVTDYTPLDGSNSSPLFSHDTYSARIAGNRVVGNRASPIEDNTGAIQAYWSDGLIVENNYIKGFHGIFIKAENTHRAPHLQDVHIRNNLVVNSNGFAFKTQTAHSVYAYNNIFAGDMPYQMQGRGGAAIEIPVWIYNNTFIATGSSVIATIRVKDGRYHNDQTEIYNNIFIDASTSGEKVWRNEEGPGSGDDIDGMARFNGNIWYKAGSGSTGWQVFGDTKTTFGAWQTYAATFGTSPVYTSETYEADSSYSDPAFTSPDYTNVEDGDWTLQNNAQDARTIGLTSTQITDLDTVICGAYVTGNEEIGLLADMNGY